MSSDSRVPSFLKLADQANWFSWKRNIQARLQLDDLWHTTQAVQTAQQTNEQIIGPAAASASTGQDKGQGTDKEQAKAWAIIYLFCTSGSSMRATFASYSLLTLTE
jgi:hypothetical protein